MADSNSQVTVLLSKVGHGDLAARSLLFRLVEEELRGIARKYMSDERPDHTLQTTVLVDDAFVKLTNHAKTTWQDRTHFYRVAARAMRRILVDHERKRRAEKRGGGHQTFRFEPERIGRDHFRLDLLALNEALEKLAKIDSRQSEIVDLHHFGGYTIQATARILNLSPKTVQREWAATKAWLHMELSRDNDDA